MKTKHGACRRGSPRPPELGVWDRMKTRCYNPKNDGYAWYGGRGIRVCDAWLADFSAFYRDMGPRPSPAHSIDRIDTDGHYEPGNCRWATQVEQQNNRRSNRRVTYK